MNDAAGRDDHETPEAPPVLSDGLELGFVRVWRKLRESAVFQDPNLLQLWIWILLRAAWGSRTVTVRTGRGNTLVNLNPGEFIFGRHAAATALRCPATTIAYRLRTLKAMKMISIHTGTHYSIVTVLNYEIYQGSDHHFRHPTRQARRHPSVRHPSGNRHKEALKALEEGKTPPSAPVEEPPFDRGNGKDTGAIQAFFDLWNSEAKTLPKATKLTEARKRKIRARLRERTLQEWSEVFRRMNASPFLCRETGGTFRADLDWIIKNEENSLKVMEGKYGNHEKPKLPPEGNPDSSVRILGFDTVGRPLYATSPPSEVAQ